MGGQIGATASVHAPTRKLYLAFYVSKIDVLFCESPGEKYPVRCPIACKDLRPVQYAAPAGVVLSCMRVYSAHIYGPIN